MNLRMTGIDFTRAGIDIRQQFSFTRSMMEEAMVKIMKEEGVRGCVMISTCNRTELWLSLCEEAQPALPEYVCRLKGLSPKDYEPYFVCRENEDAVRSLFYLSAGLKSQIVGEDQILAQVKAAIAFAREQECTDRHLEVLFRMAVTAGKKVKSCVTLDKANFSAAHQALDFLRTQGTAFAGKKCLVIGNGMMGKLTAQALMEEGADVTVTVRQYKSGMVEIPSGAKRIDYGKRYHYIPQCDLIFSATASPNVPITREKLQECLENAGTGKKQVYVDLAVPRDMEPSIAMLENVEYYDMDSLPVGVRSLEMRRQYHDAQEILEREIRKFIDWQECGDIVPRIQQIGAQTAEEFAWRMAGPVGELRLSSTDREQLQGKIKQTAAKVTDRLLYELRDQADRGTLLRVIEILERLYRQEGE